MIHMAGDNSLGDNSSSDGNTLWSDINEMEAAFEGVIGVTVLLLADEVGSGDSRLYDLHYDNTSNLASPKISLTNINATWGSELDMGDPNVLSQFAIWGITNYPANHYLLGFWDHGSGVFRSGTDTRYVCTDYHGTVMQVDEMRSALIQINAKTGAVFDIVTMDACLMAMVEVFYQLIPYAKVCVASEEEDPWEGLDYSFVGEFKDQPNITAEALSKEIVSYFYDAYNDGKPNPQDVDFATMAAVNLTRLATWVNTSLKGFVDELIKRTYYYGSTGNGELTAIRLNTQEFRTDSYVDLLDFIGPIANGNYGPILKQKAKDLYTDINASILSSVTGSDVPDAKGISIYFEKDMIYYYSAYDGSFSSFLFPKATKWDEFLHEYYNPMKRCNMTLKLEARGGDSLNDDVTLTLKRLNNTPLPGALVYENGILVGVTDGNGGYKDDDLQAGLHRFELISYDLVGIADADVKNKAPVALFDISPAIADEDQVITFNASSSYDIENDPISFQWDFDASDGLSFTDATGVVSQMSYPRKGTYTASLRALDAKNSSFTQHQVTINNIPPIPVCEELLEGVEDGTILFNGSLSTDSPSDALKLEFMWVFGDGQSTSWSSVSTAYHNYSKQGQYIATLYVRDADMAIGQKNLTVNIENLAPIAMFKIIGTSYNVSSSGVVLKENIRYDFDAGTSWDTPSDWPWLIVEWNFSFIKNSSIYETQAGRVASADLQYKGLWRAELQVRDDNGARSKAVLQFLVEDTVPTAKGSANGTYLGYEDEHITFNASMSSDSLEDRGSLRYLWDLDQDGSFEGGGMTYAASFPRSGYYQGTLKVYDTSDAYDMDTFDIWIFNKAPQILLQDNYSLAEDEALSLGSGDVKDSEEDMLSLSWAWDLDGNGGADDRSDHATISYPKKGSHTFALTVTDEGNLSSSKTVKVLVLNLPPIAVISANPQKDQLRMDFDAGNSTDTPSDRSSLQYFWDFGDGATSTQRSPKHRYSEPGTYNVTLGVKDDDGEIGTCNMIVVIDTPEKTSLWQYLVIFTIITIAIFAICALHMIDKEKEKKRIEKEMMSIMSHKLPKRKKKVAEHEGDNGKEQAQTEKKGRTKGDGAAKRPLRNRGLSR